jgi:hypothetical protein
MLRFAVMVTAAVVLAPPALATTSAVGKTVSSASISDLTPVTVPSTGLDYLSVAVPERYRSRKDFLRITTSYQAACHADALFSTIDVAGAGAEPDPAQGSMTDREGDAAATISFVTRSWFVPPSSLGGPTIPPDAAVTLKLHSDAGTGCTVRAGSIVVEIGR